MSTTRYFYSVLKNEDATPYVGGNVLIAADGLGGAGSTVHNILPIEGKTLHDEIFEAAFYDFDLGKAQKLISYLEHCVYPMADGKPDTSALWASRIAIARCAYALRFNENFVNADLSDEAVRGQLAKYISIGLDNTALHFRLEKGKYDDQKVLPTTLAFVRYAVDNKGKFTAEVVWAGDSRCYVLTKSGLKQLSIDDEDKSGAIINLFYVGGKKATVLNYRRYEFNEPCVFMAVSDGIFDPFEPHDNFGVEKTLLEHIVQNDSYEGLMQSLSDFYDKVHGDDASMAFVPLGFADYKALQEAVKDRAKLISDMWQKFYDMNAALEIADISEEDVRGYVENRTRDKFGAILTALLANYSEHSDDLIYTKEIVSIITKTKSQIAEEKKKETEKHTEIALNSLCSYMKEHLEEKPESFFRTYLPFDVPRNLFDCVYNAKRVHIGVRSALDKQEKRRSLADEKSKWLEVIKERQQFYWKEFNRLQSNTTTDKQWEEIARWLKIWIYIQVQFEKGYYLLQEINDLEYSDKKVAKAINLFIANNKSTLMTSDSEIEKAIEIARNKYFDAVDKLFSILLKTPSACSKIFNEETIRKFALNGNEVQGNGKANNESGICDALIRQQDTVIEIIVNALAENYDKTSVLDCYYNATRLNTFRIYYKLKAHPDTDIAEFEEKLKALEVGYNLLITN